MPINKSQLKIQNTSNEVININIITLKIVAYNYSEWHYIIINSLFNYQHINLPDGKNYLLFFNHYFENNKDLNIKIQLHALQQLSTVLDRNNPIPEDIHLGAGIHRNQAAVGQDILLAEDIPTHCTEDNSFFHPLKIYII